MSNSFFLKLHEQTDTRFWINNPTETEVISAIKEGAVNCTTNPAYCSRLIAQEPGYIQKAIDELIIKKEQHDEIAIDVYRETVKRLLYFFEPIYKSSGRVQGFVTMQDDPRKDEDIEYNIKSIINNRTLGSNFMAKIPVINGGIEAIEYCVNHNIPICATEIFTISQALLICDIYTKISNKTGNKPIIYITHISGIFDEYLEKVASRNKISINPVILKHAGLSIAKKQYKILAERGFKILGGGARGTHHFTEMLGADAHITINWSTADEIINQNPKLTNSIRQETPTEYIQELKEKFVEFRQAYDEDGLSLNDFAGYGPVQLFRNAFLKGWYSLLAEIATRKNKLAL